MGKEKMDLVYEGRNPAIIYGDKEDLEQVRSDMKRKIDDMKNFFNELSRSLAVGEIEKDEYTEAECYLELYLELEYDLYEIREVIERFDYEKMEYFEENNIEHV